MTAHQTPPALRITALIKTFGELTAVDRLSLEVRRGEIFGFLGPNGAGKTTTIKMMCGLLRPDSGFVEINGDDVIVRGAKGHSKIGLSPQAIVIWETLTCLEQLDFMGRMYGAGRASARRRSLDLLEVFGLQEKRNKLGKTLSGGMQRRLNIALALVHRPEILFLDEPQAGLDPQSRVLVRDYIRSLAGTTTVILTTHDMEEAEKLADRVCIIDKGKLLVLDTIENLKDRLGQGDVIEIEFGEDADPASLLGLFSGGGAFDARSPDRSSVTIENRTLSLVSTRAAALLPEILLTIKDGGFRLDHIRIRQRTLEDVFIHLTGRRLRE